VPLNGDYRLGLIVLEDQVTGSAIEYGQANNYSGGGAGLMGGFEDLPLFIFPEDMVYNNVGRAVFGGMDGVPGSLPALIATTQTYTYGFTYILPEGVNVEQLRLISLLVTPDGLVDNARPNALQEAIDQGYSSPNVSTATVVKSVEDLRVSPNPFQDHLQVQLQVKQSQLAQFRLLNSLGQEVRNSGPLTIQGNYQLDWTTFELDAGFYCLQVQVGDQQITQKLVLSK
ncbi:MAG: T9SS type A sorting domain-containing protein, partial [Phaeodactylibacter sp.]|nr:T9SS type A sorting domain-containing protein [Phaeodactylibacter sp.]